MIFILRHSFFWGEMMYNKESMRLNEIYDKVIEAINYSYENLTEIKNFAKDEYLDLEEKFLKLKIEINYLLNKIEEYKNSLKMNNAKLFYIDNNPEKFTEEEINIINTDIDKIRKNFEIESGKYNRLIADKENLEKRLQTIKVLYDRADKKLDDISIAYNILTGKFKQDLQPIENFQDKESWGIKVLEAQELERKRIAREMHDGPTQSLSNLLLKTELCIKLLDKDINRTKLELNSLKLLIRNTIDEIRRLIYNLRPMLIDDLGLLPALERLVDEINTELNIEFNINCEDNNLLDLDPIISLAIYRISQEALNNIKKHSNATKVEFELKVENDFLKIFITDNGTGFDINNINHEGNKGFGISMMRERTNLLLGEFQIFSQKNKGTTVIIKLPLNTRREVKDYE